MLLYKCKYILGGKIMDKYEELKMIYDMLSKFKGEKKVALEDQEKLLAYAEKDPTLKEETANKKAWSAVEQRLQDIELSIKLLEERLHKIAGN